MLYPQSGESDHSRNLFPDVDQIVVAKCDINESTDSDAKTCIAAKEETSLRLVFVLCNTHLNRDGILTGEASPAIIEVAFVGRFNSTKQAVYG